jgi:hypothetical protein
VQDYLIKVNCFVYTLNSFLTPSYLKRSFISTRCDFADKHIKEIHNSYMYVFSNKTHNQITANEVEAVVVPYVHLVVAVVVEDHLVVVVVVRAYHGNLHRNRTSDRVLHMGQTANLFHYVCGVCVYLFVIFCTQTICHLLAHANHLWNHDQH